MSLAHLTHRPLDPIPWTRSRTIAGSRSLEEPFMRPSFSLGIEEEYQTIDPVTRDLRSHIETEMLAQGCLLYTSRCV